MLFCLVSTNKMPFKSRAFLYGKFFPDGHECNKVDGIPLHLSVLKVCFPDVITSGFCLIGRKKKASFEKMAHNDQ
jgi:hypothetical protein